MYFIIPTEFAGIDTIIPPIISFVVFIISCIGYTKEVSRIQRHGVLEYVPPEEDVVNGEDLKNMLPHHHNSRKIIHNYYFFNV